MYSTTRRKMQNPPKDRTSKILGVFKNNFSKVYPSKYNHSSIYSSFLKILQHKRNKTAPYLG